MRKRIGMICCALGLVLCMPGVSIGEPFYLTGTANGTIVNDVNKIVGDTNYCWAASAANILAFTGWDGGPTLSTGQQIYDDIKANWTNDYGVTRVAAQWWFTGDASGGGATVTTAAMQAPVWNGFYSAADFTGNSTAYTSTHSLSTIETSLTGGYATTVRIAQWNSAHTSLTGAAHYVTAWGVDDAADHLWITDSDDGLDGLQQYDWNSGGYLSGIYSNWQITGIWGLASNAGGIDPTLRDTTPDPGTTPNPAAVPEPSTLILFGSGLLAVVSRRRKK